MSQKAARGGLSPGRRFRQHAFCLAPCFQTDSSASAWTTSSAGPACSAPPVLNTDSMR
jgi:hypothetical protein